MSRERIEQLMEANLKKMHRLVTDADRKDLAGEGMRHFDKISDFEYNDAHLMKDAHGNPIPGKYEPGFKIRETTRGKIYAHTTLSGYWRQCDHFADWMKSNGNEKFRNLREAKPFIAGYIEHLVEQYKETGHPRLQSIKTAKSALVKAFEMTQEESDALPAIPSMHNGDVIRSRLEVKSDRLVNRNTPYYKEIKNFCYCTGLRRSELTRLKGWQLMKDEKGRPYLEVKGKGGKIRSVYFCGTASQVEKAMACVKIGKDERAFSKPIDGHIDIHRMREHYATRYYRSLARDISKLKPDEIYIHKIFDKDGHFIKSIKLDRWALKMTSHVLGHNREEVVANHYLIF